MGEYKGRSKIFELRQQARGYMLQLLYLAHMRQQPISSSLTGEFLQNHIQKDYDDNFFKFLEQGIMNSWDLLDATIKQCLDRPAERLGVIEQAALRIGTFELTFSSDVPTLVAIDEAVRLVRTYGAIQACNYVNAVLDCIARNTKEGSETSTEKV